MVHAQKIAMLKEVVGARLTLQLKKEQGGDLLRPDAELSV